MVGPSKRPPFVAFDLFGLFEQEWRRVPSDLAVVVVAVVVAEQRHIADTELLVELRQWPRLVVAAV